MPHPLSCTLCCAATAWPAGNGTQDIFQADPSVLYMSTHRYDGGAFFPGTGAAAEAGVGAGEGATVNVPWDGAGVSDADMMAAFRCGGRGSDAAERGHVAGAGAATRHRPAVLSLLCPTCA